MPSIRDEGLACTLPMIPVREMVIFPHMMTPFVVGREPSQFALRNALGGDRRIFLAAQRNASMEEPNAEDIGSICKVLQTATMENGHVKVLAEGSERAELTELTNRDGSMWAKVRVVNSRVVADVESRSMTERAVRLFEQYATLERSLNPGPQSGHRKAEHLTSSRT